MESVIMFPLGDFDLLLFILHPPFRPSFDTFKKVYKHCMNYF